MSNIPIQARASHFQINLPYLKSEYDILIRLGTYEKLEEGVYTWTFPLAHWKDVNVAMAKLMQFDSQHTRDHIIRHCSTLLEEMQMSKENYGKSGYSVTKEGDGYLLTEYRRGKPIHHIVSKELTRVLWNEVFSKLRIDMKDGSGVKWYKSTYIWEKIAVALSQHHWDYPLLDAEVTDQNGKTEDQVARELIKGEGWKQDKTGNFNPKYFFGDRAYYMKLAYYPMKVLHTMGLIEYPKGVPKCRRIAEPGDFDRQERITEIILWEEQTEREEAEALRPEESGNIMAWAEAMR